MRDADCGHPHTHVGFVHWILEAAFSPHITVTFETRSHHTGAEPNFGLKQNPSNNKNIKSTFHKWKQTLLG